MMKGMQTTLKGAVEVRGVGLHSGSGVRMRLAPAPVNHGVIFIRTDMGGAEVPALWNRVVDTRLSTVLEDAVTRARVGTVEHLMAALAGVGVDNARVYLDGPEVPVMDGSSAPFVEAIETVGLARQGAARRYIQVRKPVRVSGGAGQAAMLAPAEAAHFACSIDFAHPAIGRQDAALTLTPAAFRAEVASARTFGFACEVEAMRAAGLARGGSLENAVVFGNSGPLNPEGLRAPDECARHKLLDAVGDMALAGTPMLAAYTAERPSHGLNNALLAALFADRSAWTLVEEGVADIAQAALLVCARGNRRPAQIARA
jgi:UDP-3-O-[3-hydroxymyristoyl] N-acetylglucosamine deacetylase